MLSHAQTMRDQFYRRERTHESCKLLGIMRIIITVLKVKGTTFKLVPFDSNMIKVVVSGLHQIQVDGLDGKCWTKL